MTPALTAILDRIEAGTVRIRWAHDDEHALNEAQAMAADVRSLLVLLADTAHTEADPLPDPYEVADRMASDRRSCETCAHSLGAPCSALGLPGVHLWYYAHRESVVARSLSRDCPGHLPFTAGRITVGK